VRPFRPPRALALLLLELRGPKSESLSDGGSDSEDSVEDSVISSSSSSLLLLVCTVNNYDTKY